MKSDKDIVKKVKSNQIWLKKIRNEHEKSTTAIVLKKKKRQVGFMPGTQVRFITQKSVTIIHQNRKKGNIISINVEKQVIVLTNIYDKNLCLILVKVKNHLTHQGYI